MGLDSNFAYIVAYKALMLQSNKYVAWAHATSPLLNSGRLAALLR